jgi:hypothetical protein
MFSDTSAYAGRGGGIVADEQQPMTWLPFSVVEASLAGTAKEDERDLPQAWSYLLDLARSSRSVMI